MVKVSVLMPVYKTKEEYLREAISSNRMKQVSHKIWAFVCSEHPDIWAKVQENAMFIIRPKIFGFILLGKIKQKEIRSQGLLKYCPFVTFKAKMEV